jgi:ATP-dependent helicase YprA (DUF1998 family)
MNNIDPIATANSISETYGRYLKSLVQPRQRSLADAIAKAIDDSISEPGGVVKGPFLEANPPYATGKSIRDLVAEGVLDAGFLKLGSNAFPLDRPVYKHQEEAVRKVAAGRNILVATGTGSGKTESFLIPILNYLLKQKAVGKLTPGVRALLLYPMNALANDQVKRIREILSLDSSITFGRYTGETLETYDKAKQAFVQREGKEPLANELISREQMRETPPHILLTNYAMLEYLLLRPEDSELFGGSNSNTWKFIVADEAHTYDGAHGIEVALLLKKLRERVDAGGEITTIGTTATIGGTDKDKQLFAENFFGNVYQIESNTDGERDLIEPQRLDINLGSWDFQNSAAWLDIKNSDDFSLASTKVSQSTETISERYLTNRSVSKLRNFLNEKPASIGDAAKVVFGDSSEAHQASVVQIVELGTKIKDAFGNPSFQARFHLFARATEGVFSCLGSSPHAQLARHLVCPDCDGPSFELAGCKRCGASYFGGEIAESGDSQFFSPLGSRATAGSTIYAYPVDFMAEVENEDEENFDEPEISGGGVETPSSFICAGCGLITSTNGVQCGNCQKSELIEVRFTQKANICKVCAGRGQGIIRNLESGNDAAASVLATSLYQDLPAAPIVDQAHLAGEGRKLMIFSDSRQQAAFFAPYLEGSYERIMWRRLILKSLRQAEQSHPTSEVSFLDLKPYALNEAKSSKLVSAGTGIAQENEVATKLYQEALATDVQNNLEGTGLVVWHYKLPADDKAFAPLVSLGLTQEQARALVGELLNTLRISGIVASEPGVNLGDDLFMPRTGPLFIRENEANRNIKTYAWLPKSASNGRHDFVKKVYEALGIAVDPIVTLKGIWTALSAPNGLFPGILRTTNVGAQGVVFSLDPSAILVSTLEKAERVFQCNLCRRISAFAVANVCPRFRCFGSMQQVTSAELAARNKDSHYSALYREPKIIGLSASEHTAQLTSEFAAKVQQEFIEGKINVLSSSTTFELGVDVGELQAVLLRNMPPSVANYVQRAGRAGRRADSAALILTYAQRKPHDLSMFGEPVSMVSGKMRSPFVDLRNERILERHVFSLFFSAFFKAMGVTKLPKAGQFVSSDEACLANRLLPWITANALSLKTRFEAIVPTVLKPSSDALWVKTQHELSVRFNNVRDGFLSEVAEYKALIDDLKQNSDQKSLFQAAQLATSLKTIEEKDLIGFLSKNNLLPKYGFPVDTVPLIPRRGESPLASDIELDRDLSVAIFEYAPGSQVIAAGSTWQSVGIVKPANNEKGFQKFRYAACQDCDEYQQRIYQDEDSITSCSSCASNALVTGTYLIPEWGFHATGGQNKPGDTIRRFSWNRSIHLKNQGSGVVIGGSKTPAGVTAQLKTVASLVIINSGPDGKGYKMCPWCNAAEPTIAFKPRDSHERPYKSNGPCTCKFRDNIHLGHEFQTDIVHLSIKLNGFVGDVRASSRSVAYALLEGATEGLQIAHDDIDVVPLPSTEQEIRVALIDAVPAGAGFAKFIAENINTIFESALNRVARCECGEESSCYQCLRTVNNQREHEELRRGLALAVLQHVLKRK